MRTLLRTLVAALLLVVVSADGPVFGCESLIPVDARCKLHTELGTLTIKNRSLAYVMYTPIDVEVTLTPLVVLHGGPGVGHFAYLPLKALACDGRKVVMYDQMGCGDSDIPVNISVNAPELLTVAYYVEELNEVIMQLRLAPVHLFGHSWGGMLAQEFALFNQSAIKSLILASTLASISEYTGSIQANLIPTLPPLYQDVLNQGNVADPGYQAASNYFYSLFLTRINPWADCMMDSTVKMGLEVYNGMNGPNEFTVTGTLSGWDIRSKISAITLPTLVTRGQQDEVGRDVVESILTRISGSTYFEVPLSAHMTFIDNTSAFLPALRQFIQQNDA